MLHITTTSSHICLLAIGLCLSLFGSHLSYGAKRAELPLPKDEIYAHIHQADYAITVDFTTNHAALFKQNLLLKSWDVVTGDRNGRIYPAQKHTPQGIFSLELIDLCPPWYPGSEMTHRTLTTEHSSPCGARNPLGRFALWFYEAYGFHATSTELQYRLTRDTENRRMSRGCVISSEHHMHDMITTILAEDTDDPLVAEFITQIGGNTLANNYICLSPEAGSNYGLSCLNKTLLKDIVVVIHNNGPEYFADFSVLPAEPAAVAESLQDHLGAAGELAGEKIEEEIIEFDFIRPSTTSITTPEQAPLTAGCVTAASTNVYLREMIDGLEQQILAYQLPQGAPVQVRPADLTTDHDGKVADWAILAANDASYLRFWVRLADLSFPCPYSARAIAWD